MAGAPPHPPLQVCPPAVFAASILGHPSRLATLFGALVQAFEFDKGAAALLAQAPPEAGTAYQPGKLLPSPAAPAAPQLQAQPQQPLIQPAAAGPEEAGSGAGAGEATSGAEAAGGRAAAAAAAALRQGGAAAVLLPRMPVGLAIIQTLGAYQAVAGVCRALAAAAAAAATAEGEGTAGPGGTALRRLMDQGLRRLQELGAEGQPGAQARCRAAEAAAPAGEAAPAQPWQLQAAAVAAVLAEMAFGASPAWQEAGGGGVGCLQQGSGPSQELQSLVQSLVEGLVGGPLWGLPTWQQAGTPGAAVPAVAAASSALEPSGGSGSGRLTAQQLGVNVMAVRVAVETVGTCARALGPVFARNGRLLRAALLPILERLGGRVCGCTCYAQPHLPCVCSRQSMQAATCPGSGVLFSAAPCPSTRRLPTPRVHKSRRPWQPSLFPRGPGPAGDPAPLVASAAGAAVGSICQHCGYGSLNRLVGENADYVVDGVCAQLRQASGRASGPLQLCPQTIWASGGLCRRLVYKPITSLW